MKNQHRGLRAVADRGPLGRRAAGPLGRRGPWAAGRWAAGLLLAKPGHELSQQTCLADLTLILRRTSFLRSHFERHCFLLEDDVSRREHRRSAPTEHYGLQGRPRVVVTQQQLQTLHELCGFRWNDVAETLGVSDRTLQRRRHENGMRVEGREFSSLSDAELDEIVRNIHAVTPEAGLLMVQGSLRQQGLMVQRVLCTPCAEWTP